MTNQGTLIPRTFPPRGVSAGGDAFGRLAGLVRSNQGLREDLATLDDRRAEAIAYLAAPGCNASLGMAYLSRVRDRRSRVLAALRANRLAAGEFLAS